MPPAKLATWWSMPCAQRPRNRWVGVFGPCLEVESDGDVADDSTELVLKS